MLSLYISLKITVNFQKNIFRFLHDNTLKKKSSSIQVF